MKLARPRVSVCIATYNQAPFIADSVLSVLAQDDAGVEVLVGDDGSSDGTREIVAALADRFPGRFLPVLRTGNIGGTENYQDLVRRATGDFIAHLDGDDAWLPGKLRAQVDFLLAHADCPAVYTNAVALDAAGRLLGPFTNAHPARMPLGYVAARGNYLMHSSMMYRAAHREVFTAPPPPVIDYAIHLAFARLGPLGFIDRALAVYRVGTPTSTVRTRYEFVQQLLWAALREAGAHLDAPLRREAATHFFAEVLVARVQGKAGPNPALDQELAQAAGCSKAVLMARAGPVLARLGAAAIQRYAWRAAGLPERLAVHARV
ncbi:glycosyltransferase [Caenimonas sedimenti]|uniref:Glycosyltransferase n=1 Tax=Caenimonas sedimenti TaxID=2596921 RepID=A0A562ZFU3_9BURK|nr:glycosyltransferase [Caenimonas sedimenti]TWO66653.1 glycosyltransferase [Caenimonas sedimenti]